MPKLIIICPAHPLRGGLAAFGERLAKEFNYLNWDVTIFSYSLLYPNFLFPGTSQYSSEPAPKNLRIKSIINTVNPINWLMTGYKLYKLEADIIILKFWIPFIGPSLGTILRIVKRNKKTKIICIADNIIPHEKRVGDTMLLKYFIPTPDAYVTMSNKVKNDLIQLGPHKRNIVTDHPLYDNFGDKIEVAAARKFLNIDEHAKVVLFFGFIRNYKGLDLLLHAMAQPEIRKQNIRLLIAGEYYEDRAPYDTLIQELQIADLLIQHTEFIPDSSVKYYFSACNLVVQPYRNATQSGVTPLAYHFEVPMVVTNVGGLPSLVPDRKVGIVCEPNPKAIADSILEYFETPESHFIPYIREEKRKLSWSSFVDKIIKLADDIQK